MPGIDVFPQGIKGDTGATGAIGSQGAAGSTTARNSAQFDKTANVTLSNITGLSVPLAVGSYAFRASFAATVDVDGQALVAMGGTVTASALSFDITALDVDNAGTSGRHIVTLGSGFQPSGAISSPSYCFQINGTIVVSVTGTLTVQFAQAVATGTSSVLAGGCLSVFPIS